MCNRLLHGDAEKDRTVTFVHALHMQQVWRLLELPVRTPRRVVAGLWGHDGWWPLSLPAGAVASNALLWLTTCWVLL